jgi:hypothetical protein
MSQKKCIFPALWLSLVFIQIMRVAAEDGENERESEFGDLGQLFGSLAIAFFIITLIVGLILFLNRYKSVREIIKKLHIPMKIFWKGHHPIAIVTYIVWIVHGLLMLQGGEDGAESGWAVGIIWGIFLVSGILFSFIKITNKYRMILRIIHLLLAITAGIMLVIHVE